MAANNIKYLHSEQPQNRPVIRRQLPSLTALPENIFRPGTTAGSNPHMSGLAQGAFGGSRRCAALCIFSHVCAYVRVQG